MSLRINPITGEFDKVSDANAILNFGNDSLGSSATIRYLTPGYSERLAEVQDTNHTRVTRRGTLKNLHIIHNVLGGAATVITYTVEVNGSATSLAVGMAADTSLGANTTISVPVSKGDRVRIRVTKAAAVASPKNVHVTVEFA